MPTAQSDRAPVDGAQSDRLRTGPKRADGRNSPRLLAAQVPSITGIRLRPFGADAKLVNISAGGVLVECVSRLRLGTAVTVVFDGSFTPAMADGRVVRGTVANVGKDGVLRYHVGIAFHNPIPLDVPVRDTADPLQSVEAEATPPPTSPDPSVASGPTNRW
jgi:PilZ domain-containing protein